MLKSSLVSLVCGLGFFVACAPAEDGPEPAQPAPVAAPTPQPAAPSEPTTETPPTNAPTPSRAVVQVAPTPAPVAIAVDPKDPIAVKTFCEAHDANRPSRGAFSGQPSDADVTAVIYHLDPIPGVTTAPHARLSIRVGFAPEKRVDPKHGPERSDSWIYTNLEIESAAGKDAFAVGTYDGVAIDGSGGSNVCFADGGFGGSGTNGPNPPVKLVITKRTADLIEGTYGDKSFTAALAEPYAAGACCL